MESSIGEVELRESEIIEVWVHLVSWPDHVHEVANGIQSDEENPNISTWQSVNDGLKKSVEATASTTSSAWKVPFCIVLEQIRTSGKSASAY